MDFFNLGSYPRKTPSISFMDGYSTISPNWLKLVEKTGTT